MQERRKYPRTSIDLPVTVRLPRHHVLALKMIELSVEGMRFLCSIAPEINSEIEVCFSLPSRHIMREFKFMANVRHLYEVQRTPDTPPDYRYVLGVNFMNLQENERAILDKFLTESCGRQATP